MRILRQMAAASIAAAIIVALAMMASSAGASRLVGNAAAQGPVAITIGGVRTAGRPAQPTGGGGFRSDQVGALADSVAIEAVLFVPVALADWAAKRRRAQARHRLRLQKTGGG